jgi:SNF2 family DNA or RNA helicase
VTKLLECRLALVICPASLLGNWRAEFAKWAGDDWSAFVVEGKPMLTIDKLLHELKSPGCELGCRVLVCSYDCYRIHGRAILQIHFDIVICDEAHKMKTECSSLSKMIDLLPRRRLLLTGTPLQNNLQEMFVLMDEGLVRVIRWKRVLTWSRGNAGA